MWTNSFGTIGDNGQDLALSADGSILSYATGDGQGDYGIAEFDTSNMSQLGLLGTGAYPREVAFSPNGPTVFTAHTTDQVEYWNTGTFSELGTATTTGDTTQLGVDAAGNYLYDSVNGTIAIYKISSAVTSYNIGDTNQNGVLDPGETWTYTASSVAKAGSWSDTVTVNATDSNGQSVSGTDTSSYDGIDYAIALADELNGAAATVPPGNEITVGASNLWTYTVTNPGSVALANVTVTDDDGTPDDTGNALTATYVSGDTNGDGLLEPGETWIFKATTTALSGSTAETAHVTATPVNSQGTPIAGAGQVSASVYSYYQGVTAQMSVQTTVDNYNADSLPGGSGGDRFHLYSRDQSHQHGDRRGLQRASDRRRRCDGHSDLGRKRIDRRLEKTFPSLTAARFLADPTRPYVYATIPASNSVDVFDTSTMTLVATVPIGTKPEGMALSNDDSKLYVADSGSTTIGVLDTATLTALPSITISAAPYDVGVGADGRLFVLESNAIAQINPNTGASAGPNFSGSGFSVYGGQIVVSPQKDRLYYANFGLSPATLYQFDISTNTPTLIFTNPFGTIGDNGQDLAISADGSVVSFACGDGQGNYEIAEYRTSDMSELGVFDTGPYPREITFSPDGQAAFTAHTSGQIEAWNTSTFAESGTATTSGATTQLGVDGAGTDLFVSVNGTIAVYQINTTTTTYNVGDVNHNGKLDPGETWVYTSTGVAQSGINTYQITATGSDPSANTVTDVDASSYYGATTLETIQNVGGQPLVNLTSVIGSSTSSDTVSDSRFSLANGWLQAQSGQTLSPSADSGLTLLVRNSASKIVDEVDLQVSASALPWHNAALPEDVEGTGNVTPLDAVAVINALNIYGGGTLYALPTVGSVKMVDVNGDGSLTPIDAVYVISYLNVPQTAKLAAAPADESVVPSNAPAISSTTAAVASPASVAPTTSLSSTPAVGVAAVAGTAGFTASTNPSATTAALPAALMMPLASRTAAVDAVFASQPVSSTADAAADALTSTLRPRRVAAAASVTPSATSRTKLSSSLEPNDATGN